MQDIIRGILISETNETIKIVLLNRIRSEIESLDNVESFSDLIVNYVTKPISNQSLSDEYINQIYSVFESIILRLSTNSLFKLHESIIEHYEQICPLTDISFENTLVIKLHQLISERKFQELLNNVPNPILFYQNLKTLLKIPVNSDNKIYSLINSFLICDLNSITYSKFSVDEYIDFIVVLFNLLKSLNNYVECKISNGDQSSNCILKRTANYILMLIKDPKSCNFSTVDESTLLENLHRLLQNTLTENNPENNGLSTGSIIFELVKICPDNAILFENLHAFIKDSVQYCREDFNKGIRLLHGLTLWLNLNAVYGADSFCDVWFIGFVCEFCNVFKFEFNDTWNDLIDWQLKYVIGVMTKMSVPDDSIINILCFCILWGGITPNSTRIKIVLSEIPSIVKRLLTVYKYSYNEKIVYVFKRLHKISQMLLGMLCDFSHTEEATFICDKIKMFVSCLPSEFIDKTQVSVWRSRSKMYNMKTLQHFGPNAGVHLRKLWSRWDEVDVNSSSKLSFKLENKMCEYSGLRNVGNTCYANAALQLLYHCLDFRYALLNSGSIDDSRFPKTKCLIANNSPITQIDQLSRGHSRFTNGGILHANLFSLFHLLYNRQTPSIDDLSTILTVSKPEHFVIGEQQDAAEYLNHLLDRLHEEEKQLFAKIKCNKEHDRYSENDTNSVMDYTCKVVSADEPLSFIANSTSALTEKLKSDNLDGFVASSTNIFRLFGGTLLRHTSCIECKHVSSERQEQFTCLYVPLTKPSQSISYNEHVKKEHDNSENSFVEPGTDLATLIGIHFTQTERIPSCLECESCGKKTSQARRLVLQELSSHVLICLNLFTFCRINQTTSKIMHRIHIPERLSVVLSPGKNEFKDDPTELSFDVSSDNHSNRSHIENGNNESNCRTYKLQAMIIHSGISISCGHYTCVARVGMKWILFDDEYSNYTTLEKVYSEPSATPYLLLYSQM